LGNIIKDKKILITGGAGFIGSNLCNYFIKNNNIVCLDNFATGHFHNIAHLIENKNFELIEGDIRDYKTCENAVSGVDFVLHQAALGSVPRSINDPLTSNEVNVSGFLNILQAAAKEGVSRFVYAASSSTYGDSESLPKVENIIGKPLSPYAVTKYVNELYADVFSKIYGIETIGLRYFNVFGRNQDPNGAYAAVIPKFVKSFINHENPVVNGDGNFSRDFTYIENVVHMNEKALETNDVNAINTVYNTAFGERTTLNELINYLKEYLSEFDSEIAKIEVKYGSLREGDIPHSLASVDKAKKLLNYNPKYSLKEGLKEAVEWYWKNLK
jgi:UDP-N-acetylglucosamine 4-epimerase